MIKFLGVFCLFLSVLFSAQLFANEALSQLLHQAKTSDKKLVEDIRLTEFKQAGIHQANLIALAKKRLLKAKEVKQRLQKQFKQANQQITDLNNQLKLRSSELNLLFPVLRKQAKRLFKRFDFSFTSGRFSGRKQQLSFTNHSKVPQLQDFKALWFLTLQEIATNTGLQRYKTVIVDANGELLERNVLQIGAFSVIDETGQYLQFNQQLGKFQAIANQNSSLKKQARNFFAAKTNQLIVDPLKGELLLQQSQLPSLQQKLHQGGLVGFIILGLGSLGLAIAAWRMVYITYIERKIKRQLKSNIYQASNPLGRILLAAENANVLEKAELLIDQAVLQEVHQLERCHSFVKLLAAVAPLLGLLGTVTGMIVTFQTINLVGTNDPKLMAGGISQALITTVMGLCVAIPLLFCHSYISGRSKYMLQLLQQQSLLFLSDYFSHNDQDENAAQQVVISNSNFSKSETSKQSQKHILNNNNVKTANQGRPALV